MPVTHEDLVRPDACFDRFATKVVSLDFDDAADFAYAAGELGILQHYVLIRAVQISGSGGVIYGGPTPKVVEDLVGLASGLLSGGLVPDFVIKLILERLKQYVLEEVANPVILDKAAAYVSTFLKKAA